MLPPFTTEAHQASLSMRFSRQVHWRMGMGMGIGCPPPGDLPDPGLEPASLMSPVLVGSSLPLALPRKPNS